MYNFEQTVRRSCRFEHIPFVQYSGFEHIPVVQYSGFEHIQALPISTIFYYTEGKTHTSCTVLYNFEQTVKKSCRFEHIPFVQCSGFEHIPVVQYSGFEHIQALPISTIFNTHRENTFELYSFVQF